MLLTTASAPPAWDPWDALTTRHPHVCVRYTPHLPAHMLGATDGSTIWLATDQSSSERRCTLAHELIHIELGHHCCQPARVEQAVEAEAARRLIPLGRLQAALAWTACEAETAEALDVDVAMLRTRIAGLTEVERAQIGQAAA